MNYRVTGLIAICSIIGFLIMIPLAVVQGRTMAATLFTFALIVSVQLLRACIAGRRKYYATTFRITMNPTHHIHKGDLLMVRNGRGYLIYHVESVDSIAHLTVRYATSWTCFRCWLYDRLFMLKLRFRL